MKPTLVEKEVVYFEDVYDNIEEIIDTIFNLNCEIVTDWEPWYGGGDPEGSQYGHTKFLRGWAIEAQEEGSDKEKSIWLIETLRKGMEEAFLSYSEIFNIDEVSIRFGKKAMREQSAQIGVSYYLPGDGMGPHIDWNEFNSDISYTIVVYLNDDYEGGELSFVEPELEGLKIKPKSGSIVIFPSFMPYKHKSEPIPSGRKMLITHHWKGGKKLKRIQHLLSVLKEKNNA